MTNEMIDTTSTADIPVSQVLHKAANWKMTKALVLGVDKDGRVCFGGSFCGDTEVRALLKNGVDYLDALQHDSLPIKADTQ